MKIKIVKKKEMYYKMLKKNNPFKSRCKKELSDVEKSDGEKYLEYKISVKNHTPNSQDSVYQHTPKVIQESLQKLYCDNPSKTRNVTIFFSNHNNHKLRTHSPNRLD